MLPVDQPSKMEIPARALCSQRQGGCSIITTAIDCREELDCRGLLIEDRGFEDVLRAFRKMPGGIPQGRWLVRRLQELLMRSQRGNLAQQLFELLDLEMVRNALPYLAMGIDAADDAMSHDEDSQMYIRWKHP
jgi:hypothetical protein